jgi:hypothetical protein
MKVISEFITWAVTSLPLKENLALRFEPRRGGYRMRDTVTRSFSIEKV